MAMKVWKGHLNFGMVSIPVYLNTGARDEHTELCNLHSCGSRIKRPDFCPKCNKQIGRDEISKAYEKGDDCYVVLDKAELDAIAPASEKVMDIDGFVPRADVDEIYFAESYYLLPEPAGQNSYALLAKALTETDRVAIAQLTKNSREHVVLIRAAGHRLMLHMLYYAHEVNRVPEWDYLEAAALPNAQVKLAVDLVKQMAEEFDPERFENGYDMRLNQLIASKLDKAVKAPVAVTSTAKVLPDLTAALQASLARPGRKITVESKKAPKRRAA